MEGNGQTRLMKKWHGMPAILLVTIVVSPLAIGSHAWIVGAWRAKLSAPSQIHLTWATNDVYTTMTVSWWTLGRGASVVLYDTISHGGVIGKYAYRAEGVSQRVADFEGWYHDVELTGLTPGTTYYFVCGSSGGWSEEYKFRTIAEDELVSFVLGGDSRRPWGGGYEIKVSPTAISNWPYARDWVSTTMAEEYPDFVIFIGDLVNEGNDQEQWTNWLEMVQERFVTPDGRMIPLVPVIGNHEMGAWPDIESSYEYFTGIFALPENELVPEYSELAYSLDFPDLHVTVLATTGGCVATWWDPAEEEAEEQVEWLREDLAGSDAEWKVVAFHIPYYSSFAQGTGYPSELYLREWALILDDPAYGVDIVATGHVHNYMRSWPIHTTEIEEVELEDPPFWTDVGYRAVYELKEDSSEGVTYIVQGCWGAPTDPYEEGTDCDIRDLMAEAAARPSYTLAELTDGELHVVTKDTRGNVLDDFTLPYTGLGPALEYNFRI